MNSDNILDMPGAAPGDAGDPRLTAYALGEMEPMEAEAFAAEIGGDPGAQAEVAAIRAFAEELRGDFALEVEQKVIGEQVVELPVEQLRNQVAARKAVFLPWLLKIAAVLVIGATTGYLVLREGGVSTSVEKTGLASARPHTERSPHAPPIADASRGVEASIEPWRKMEAVSGAPEPDIGEPVDTLMSLWILEQDPESMTQQQVDLQLAEFRRQAAKILRDREIALAEASRRGAKVDSAFLDQEQTRFVKERFAGDETKFLEELANAGLTLAKWRERKEQELLILAVREDVIPKTVEVTDAQLAEMYARRKGEFMKPRAAKVKMISLAKQPADGSATRQEQRELAEDLRRRVDQGEDFSELARQYSQDSYASAGGSLGLIDEHVLNARLTAEIFSQTPGKVSKVVDEGPFYRLFLVDLKSEGKTPSLDELRAELTRLVKEEKRAQAWEQWLAHASVRQEAERISLAAAPPAAVLPANGPASVEEAEFRSKEAAGMAAGSGPPVDLTGVADGTVTLQKAAKTDFLASAPPAPSLAPMTFAAPPVAAPMAPSAPVALGVETDRLNAPMSDAYAVASGPSNSRFGRSRGVQSSPTRESASDGAALAPAAMPLSQTAPQSYALLPAAGTADGVRPRMDVTAPMGPSGRYAPTQDLPFQSAVTQGVSTFSVDVDTASYATMRRLVLDNGRLPERDVVRVEEMINYFRYAYPAPDWQAVRTEGVQPFSISVDSAAAPWQPAHRLVRIGLKGAEVKAERPASNLVFLIDVSGSMGPSDRLPLLQQSLREFVRQLTARDRVTLVVYAGNSGEVLAPTPGNDQGRILTAIDALSAGGSTNGAAGLSLAYQRAREHFIEGGVNRVLLATDGDFNVGMSSDDALVALVEREAKTGVSLTVLGVGQGNLNDSMLEKITQKGNGQYHYIDRLSEGQRILVEQMSGALVTIAKDVKIQVEFNPGRVASYRLIGYANRVMPREHFEDDTKDAGDIGAGHTVTAFYEVVPLEAAGLTQGEAAPQISGRRYLEPVKANEPAEEKGRQALEKTLGAVGARLVQSDEMLTVRLRYKQPEGTESRLIELPHIDKPASFAEAGADFRFASAVAAFGMRLRGTEFPGAAPRFSELARLASEAVAATPGLEGAERERRLEFVRIIERAMTLAGDDGAAIPNEATADDVRRKLEGLR